MCDGLIGQKQEELEGRQERNGNGMEITGSWTGSICQAAAKQARSPVLHRTRATGSGSSLVGCGVWRVACTSGPAQQAGPEQQAAGPYRQGPRAILNAPCSCVVACTHPFGLDM
jgi:hypothetical protein